MGRLGLLLLGALGGAALLFLAVGLTLPGQPRQSGTTIAYSEMLALAADGSLDRAVLQGRTMTATTKDGRQIAVQLPDDPGLARSLAGQGARVSVLPEADEGNPVLRLIVNWLPFLIYLVVFLVPLRAIRAELRGIRVALDRTASSALPPHP